SADGVCRSGPDAREALWGRAVRGARRGWDPYGAPITFFRSIGDEINQALDPVVTALTGVAARD
ncbi:hypothetical protein ACIGXD_15195, partial [Streptomyces gardneri]